MYFRSFAAVACVVEPICDRKTGCSLKKEALGYSSNQLSFPTTLIKPVTVYLSDQPSSNIFHNNLHHLFLCTAQLKEVDTDSLTLCFLNNKKCIDRESSEWKRKSASFFVVDSCCCVKMQMYYVAVALLLMHRWQRCCQGCCSCSCCFVAPVATFYATVVAPTKHKKRKDCSKKVF